MAEYGLQRGIEGSEARHITTQQYYRDLHLQNENLMENIEDLQEQKEEANNELSQIKNEIKTEKLKSSAVDVATSAIEEIGSMLGSSKVKRQQQEIEELKSENAGLQTVIKTLKQQIQINETEYMASTQKHQQEMDKIFTLFPKVKELLGIEKLCRHLGFEEDLIKRIFEMKPLGFKGKLYSSEYHRDFETDYSVAEIKPYLSDPDKLKLTIDGLDNVSWFRQKQKEFLERIGIKIQPKQPKMKQSI